MYASDDTTNTSMYHYVSQADPPHPRFSVNLSVAVNYFTKIPRTIGCICILHILEARIMRCVFANGEDAFSSRQKKLFFWAVTMTTANLPVIWVPSASWIVQLVQVLVYRGLCTCTLTRFCIHPNVYNWWALLSKSCSTLRVSMRVLTFQRKVEIHSLVFKVYAFFFSVPQLNFQCPCRRTTENTNIVPLQHIREESYILDAISPDARRSLPNVDLVRLLVWCRRHQRGLWLKVQNAEEQTVNQDLHHQRAQRFVVMRRKNRGVFKGIASSRFESACSVKRN